jgi:hypothetical protein
MHPLEEFFWRFGPVSRFGATFNAVVCGAGVLQAGMAYGIARLPLPAIALAVVFVAIAVLAWTGRIPTPARLPKGMSRELRDLVNQGCDAADRGDHREAVKLFSKAVGRGELWVGLNLGNSLRALDEPTAAAAAFELAWRRAHDDDAGFNLALTLEDGGDIAGARAVFQELVRAGYVKAMDQEAWYLSDEGREAEARELLTMASVDSGPDGDRAAGILGTWMWDENHEATAEPLLQRGADHWAPAGVALRELHEMHAPHPD